MKKKWILSILLAGLIAILGACSDSDNNSSNEDKDANNGNSEETAEGQPEMPEPDLEGLPDEVAEVNGESIPKKEFKDIYSGQFQQAMMQAQMSGQELDQDDLKAQVADMMIDQELATQEANGKNYDVSDKEKQDVLDDLVEQSGLESEDKFLDSMDEQDLDEDEVMEEIEKQVIVDKLIAEEAGDTEPSEEEVKDFYDRYKEQQEESDSDEEVKSFDDLKPRIVDQLEQQKKNEAYQTLVEKLREDADVTNNLS